MLALGSEITDFYFHHWPDDDYYQDEGELEVVDDVGNEILIPTKKYNLRKFGDLIWQGEGEKDPISFEKAFKQWRVKSEKQLVLVEISSMGEDFSKLQDFCLHSGMKIL